MTNVKPMVNGQKVTGHKVTILITGAVDGLNG